jgi:hypothetical protein
LRRWIELGHCALSIAAQCELFGLPRSSYCYEPAPETAESLCWMRRIDEQYLVTPFYGSRRMTDSFVREGYSINRKRVQRLMRIMGLEGLFPGRKTTIPAPEHKVYPYLLRSLTIDRPDQVWCSDITYVPLRCGYFYLVAMMDWFSRHVLAWRLPPSIPLGRATAFSARSRPRFCGEIRNGTPVGSPQRPLRSPSHARVLRQASPPSPKSSTCSPPPIYATKIEKGLPHAYPSDAPRGGAMRLPIPVTTRVPKHSCESCGPCCRASGSHPYLHRRDRQLEHRRQRHPHKMRNLSHGEPAVMPPDGHGHPDDRGADD